MRHMTFAAKSDADVEREKSLIDQWVCLTEERNAVLVPAAGSGIPGAPADWEPPPGMEEHVPVIFLDLDGTCLVHVEALRDNSGTNDENNGKILHGGDKFLLMFNS